MIDKYIKQIFGDYEERIKQDYGIIEVNPNVDEYNVSYRVHTHARAIFFKEKPLKKHVKIASRSKKAKKSVIQ